MANGLTLKMSTCRSTEYTVEGLLLESVVISVDTNNIFASLESSLLLNDGITE